MISDEKRREVAERLRERGIKAVIAFTDEDAVTRLR